MMSRGSILPLIVLLAAPPALAEAQPGPVYVTEDMPLEVDTCAAAWLIRRYVDPEARFVFVRDAAERIAGATTFDMPFATFPRSREVTVFEQIAQRHGIADATVAILAPIVRDIELNTWNEKQSPYSLGLDTVILGLNELGETRPITLERALVVLDAFVRRARIAHGQLR